MIRSDRPEKKKNAQVGGGAIALLYPLDHCDSHLYIIIPTTVTLIFFPNTPTLLFGNGCFHLYT